MIGAGPASLRQGRSRVRPAPTEERLGSLMTRFARIGALLSVIAGVLLLTGATLADTSNYPSRIDFPAPTVDPTTGVVTTNFSPEGIAVSGNTFYAPST